MKILKKVGTITEGGDSVNIDFDVVVTEEEKKAISRYYQTSNWYEALPVSVIVTDAVAGGSPDPSIIQPFMVSVSNPSGNTVRVTITVGTDLSAGQSIQFLVTLIVPHSFIR